MVKAVLFDLGDVLEICQDGQWQLTVLEHLADSANLPVDVTRSKIVAADLPDTGLCEGTEALYWRGIELTLGLTPVQTENARQLFWELYCGKPNTELLEFAHKLSARITVGILSNSGDGARREEEARYQHSHWFNPIYYSHELGVEKPDPLIFAMAAEGLNLPAQEVLFIDNQADNIAVASDCGMETILHTSNATTITEIQQLVGLV